MSIHYTGLPHAHIILIVRPEDRPDTPEKLDKMVYAELPDPNTNPELHAAVKSHMLHGPCGIANPGCSCMRDGECKSDYPKPWRPETEITHNHFAYYRRRDTGQSVMVKGVPLDNRSVVPYNPTLMRLDCHINVECINSVQSLKYLFKYLMKGQDRSTIALQAADAEVDEIAEYREARYICPSEATMHIFGTTMFVIAPPIYRLTSHQENQQYISFHSAEQAQEMVAQDPPDTQLTSWFRYNAGADLPSEEPALAIALSDMHVAHQLRYVDFSRWFVYTGTTKVRSPLHSSFRTSNPRMYMFPCTHMSTTATILHICGSTPSRLQHYAHLMSSCARSAGRVGRSQRTIGGHQDHAFITCRPLQASPTICACCCSTCAVASPTPTFGESPWRTARCTSGPPTAKPLSVAVFWSTTVSGTTAWMRP